MLINSSVTEKHCADCGSTLPISEFDIYKKNGKPRYGTYCKTHRRARNNATSRKYYQKNREHILEKEVAIRKTPEYKSRQAAYKKNETEKLSDGIVTSWLAKRLDLKTDEVKSIPGLIEAERTRLKVARKIKLLTGEKDGFRICSYCLTKKPLEEFRERTEKRKDKPPYTYRSGQCKICESKIKNSYARNKI